MISRKHSRLVRLLLVAAMVNLNLKPLFAGTPSAGTAPEDVSSGSNQTVAAGAAVQMHATFTGSPIAMDWDQLSGPPVSLNENAENASFTANLNVGGNGTVQLVFRFTATYITGFRSSDVTITVYNTRPSVTSQPQDSHVAANVPVGLDCSAVDADGHTIAGYAWIQTAGPAVALNGANTSHVSFTSPNVQALTTVSLQCTATDAYGASGSNNVDVNVDPNLRTDPPFSHLVVTNDMAANSYLRGVANVPYMARRVTDNRQPTSVARNLTTPVDTPKVVASNATDQDSGANLISAVLLPPMHGSLVQLTPTSFQYTPTFGFQGQDGFALRTSDSQGSALHTMDGETAEIVNIQVGTNPNQPPVIHGQNFSNLFNASRTYNLSYSDPDSNGLNVTGIVGLYGNVAPNGYPSVTFTPFNGFAGRAEVVFGVTDGQGNTTVGLDTLNMGDPQLVDLQSSVNGKFYGNLPLNYGGGNEDFDTLGTGFSGDGIYSLGFSGSDQSGASASGSGSANVDNTAPVCVYRTPTTPAANSWVKGSIDLQVVATDPGATASGVDEVNLRDPKDGFTILPYARVNDPQDQDYPNLWQKTYNTIVLSDGAHDYRSFCVDVAGNQSNPDITRSLKSDNNIPSGTIDVAPAPVDYNGKHLVKKVENVSVNGIDTTNGSGIKDIKLYLDALLLTSANGSTLTYPLDTQLYADGDHVLGADIRDNVLNIGSANLDLTFDNTAPSISIVAPTAGQQVQSLTEVIADITDAYGVAQVDIFDNNVLLSYARNGNVYDITDVTSPAGAHTLKIVAYDTIGNKGTASVVYQILSNGNNNHPPVAQNQNVSTREDTPKSIILNATDQDGDPLTYSVVSLPAHGSLNTTTAQTVVYTPSANYNGPDSFTFKANDGHVDSNVATVSINVTPVNDAPVANNGSQSLDEDGSANLTLTASDIDGDALTYLIVTTPLHGTLSGSGASRTYTPNANYNGPDSFTFKVNDGNLDSNIATFTLTINPVNDAPVANGQSVSTPEDTSKMITLSGTDIDGDNLSYIIVANPLHGALSGSGADRTYTPNANYNGPDSFTFKVNDGTVDSNVATVSITVTPVNDAPVANNGSDSLNEDSSKLVTMTGSDAEGDVLAFIVVGNPQHGSLSGSGASRTYTPAANYNGPDSFTFKANDGNSDSNIATFSLTINPVNDAPVADDQNVGTPMNTPKMITLSATDIDGDALTYVIASQPSHGTLGAINGDQVGYTPAPGYIGQDSFTFRANDGTTNSNIATVTIVVGSVNQPPVASNVNTSTNEDLTVTVTFNAVDPDNGPVTPLAYQIVSGPSHGVLGSISGNQVTYTPATNYNGPDSFTYRAFDGELNSNTATVSITVDPVNDAPFADDQSVSTAEDTSKAIVLTGSDVEGSSLSFSIVTQPAHGSISGIAPNVTYTPAANYNGADSFTFKSNDGALDSAAATISINVTPVNDAPAASNGSDSTNEDTPKSLSLTAADADGDSLTYIIVTAPAHGSLTGSGSSRTYTPDANYHGADGFTFKVNDGSVDSNVATFSLTINSVNDAPAAQNDSKTTQKNTPVSITLLATDVENDALTYSVVAPPAHGALSGTAPNLTYTPSLNYVGADSFTFKANDGNADSNIATISITVQGSNNAPTADDKNYSTNEDVAVNVTLSGSDPDNDPLTFQVVSGPSHGTLSGTAPNLAYTPDANWNGLDSFQYVANDGTVNSAPATVSITVNPVDDNPSITFIDPVDGDWLHGIKNLRILASDDGSLTNVLFIIDGVSHPASDLGNGQYGFSWNTNGLAEGLHTIVAQATDNNGHSASSSIQVTVDNTLSVVDTTTPADGASVSNIVNVAATFHDNRSLGSAGIYIDGTLMTTKTFNTGTLNGSINFSWDTSGLVAGSNHTIEFRIADKAGNLTSSSSSVTAQGGSGGSAPVITVMNPQNNGVITGVTVFRMRVLPTNLTSANIQIDGVDCPNLNNPNPGEYTCSVNTLTYPDGNHTGFFTATNPDGTDSETINVEFDSLKPALTVDKPQANQTLFFVQNIIAHATDAHLMLVRFTISNEGTPIVVFFNPNSNPSAPYSYALDTEAEDANGNPLFLNGHDYMLTAQAQDQAGNLTNVQVPFKVDQNNLPPSNGHVVWTPAGPFAKGPIAHISAEIQNVGIDPTQVSGSTLRIYYDRDGNTNVRLPGTVALQGNTIHFNADPNAPIRNLYNCHARFVLSLVDADGNALRETLEVSIGMDKDLGGQVLFYPDNFIKVNIQPGALQQDAVVEITKLPSDAPEVSGADESALNQNEETVYGPLLIAAHDAQNNSISDLNGGSSSILFDRPAQQIPDTQKNSYVDQMQTLVNRVWKPLGTSSGAGSNALDAGARTINVHIDHLGIFRVTSFAAPGPGVTDLFNYPNPFTPGEGKTQLQYMLGSDCDVKIVIYDLLGNLVRITDYSAGSNGGKSGQNTVEWDGKNGEGTTVGNGGYIVVVRAKDAGGKEFKARHKIGVVK